MTLLRDFKKRLTVISGDEANLIRNKYIARFVDTTSDYFQKHIAVKRQFKDGLYYFGYLWDTFKHSELITEKQILENKDLLDKIIYIFWDLHSSEKILIKDYWKFPKEAVLKMRYRDLLSGLEYLPEDIYIFDEEFTWSLILTHEYDDKGNRFCLKAT